MKKPKFKIGDRVTVSINTFPVTLFVRSVWISHREHVQYILAESLYDECHSITSVDMIPRYYPVKKNGKKAPGYQNPLAALWTEAELAKA